MLTDQLREVEREKTEHSRLIQLLEDDTFNKSETMEHVRSLLGASCSASPPRAGTALTTLATSGGPGRAARAQARARTPA